MYPALHRLLSSPSTRKWQQVNAASGVWSSTGIGISQNSSQPCQSGFRCCNVNSSVAKFSRFVKHRVDLIRSALLCVISGCGFYCTCTWERNYYRRTLFNFYICRLLSLLSIYMSIYLSKLIELTMHPSISLFYVSIYSSQAIYLGVYHVYICLLDVIQLNCLCLSDIVAACRYLAWQSARVVILRPADTDQLAAEARLDALSCHCCLPRLLHRIRNMPLSDMCPVPLSAIVSHCVVDNYHLVPPSTQ